MRSVTFLLVAVVMLFASAAEAKNVKFAGPHPLSGRPGDGLCYIQGVHVHPAPPANMALYRQQGGVYMFVGDPVPYGWDGPKVQYYGHHPVAVDVAAGPGAPTVYCYLNGPHWHPFEPPAAYTWKQKGNVYYYTGAYPPEYERDRPRYAVVNDVYRPMTYERPVVVEAPPPEYRGPILEVGVNVPAPAVVVGAPPPRAVVVGAPPPRVVVGVPAPPAVVIGVPGPPTVVVGAPAPVIVVPPGHAKKFKRMKFKGR